MSKLLIVTTALAMGASLVFFQNCGQIPSAKISDKDLSALYQKIEKTTSASCTQDSECKQISVGNKPCGGPWGYIVYSKDTTDEENLILLVKEVFKLETQLNLQANDTSICDFSMPYESLHCESDICSGS